jgi:MBG domain-containing protein
MKHALSIDAVTDSKVYDGTKDSSGTPTVSGLQAADSVTGKVQKFQSKNVMGSGGSTLEVTAYTVYDGNSGGNYDVTTHTASGTITKAPLTVTADNKTMTVNGTVPTLTYAISGFVGGETLATSGVTGTANCSTADGTAVGTFDIVCSVGSLSATNYSFATFVKGTLTVKYSTANCVGAAGHSILQPINADGTSVFKQGSTVPAKFRVCDANGNSIGTAGVVSNFQLEKTISGLSESTVNEPVDSTTPDTAFRWSSTDQLWIFNINTKKLNANKTYVYKISLNDGTYIQFQFGLK